MRMKFRPFQFRWREPLGLQECPYMYRWVCNLGLFSVRLHHWLRSDDKRFFHDHPWVFLSIIIKGGYTDVSSVGWYRGNVPITMQAKYGYLVHKDGEILEKDEVTAGAIRFRGANHSHYVEVPKGGCWSLLLCGPPVRKWGFWIKGKFYRPLRFFSRHGHPPCTEQ